MRHNAAIITVICCGISALPAQSLQQVIAVKKRNQILSEGESLTHLQDPPLKQKIAELSYPFSFKPDEKLEPIETSEQDAEPTPVSYSDKQILQSVAKNLDATGVIIQGNRPYLILPNGNIPMGSKIKVNYRGIPYTIVISDIDQSRYILKLNQASFTKYFEDSSDDDKYWKR